MSGFPIHDIKQMAGAQLLLTFINEQCEAIKETGLVSSF